jgi:AmmeMemoRadiSam system protein A
MGQFDQFLTAEERQTLLSLARRCLALRASGCEPESDLTNASENLAQRRGCFVTLFRDGELRGCIGHVTPQMELHKAVCRNACAAGFSDPRFEPVAPWEVPKLEIEVSVLSELRELPSGSPEEILHALTPHMHGVVIKHGGMTSTFLPQVWEKIPDKEDFLHKLCQKAGWQKEAWMDQDVSISTYEVLSFSSNAANDRTSRP